MHATRVRFLQLMRAREELCLPKSTVYINERETGRQMFTAACYHNKQRSVGSGHLSCTMRTGSGTVRDGDY